MKDSRIQGLKDSKIGKFKDIENKGLIYEFLNFQIVK